MLRTVIALGLVGGAVGVGGRILWQLLSPLAAIGLRELFYLVWLVTPLAAALRTGRVGAAAGVAVTALAIEIGVLGGAPVGARLAAGAAAELGVWAARRDRLRWALLIGVAAAVATLPSDPPVGVAALGWTGATAATARGVSGLMAGGLAWALRRSRV